MKAAYGFLAAISLVHLVTILAYPWRGAAFVQFLVFVVLGALVMGSGALISRFLRKIQAHGESDGLDFAEGEVRESSLQRTSILCVVLVVAQLTFVKLAAPHLTSFWVFEGIYYAILVAAGVALALWSRSPPYVGAVVASVAILTISIISLVQFFGNPGADFQYGPEKWIFALQNHLGRMNMWPLDAAFASAACLIAGNLVKQRAQVQV